ncbi:probable glutathione S-transferase GSTU6 [Brachypodium distachyon]|uniref:glutathione transferase n=1 Tax=Brachypodium distachyon TaxID=15368 RepID=I1HCG7_BRADI|nr:probable glutathione S-transferase GSTU6 [Brachypodium distachyon]KQK02932.1 hypothetical protein BRADI_2g04497v3 [Brachypodium distachyon]|eukprot:XP_003565398.1 probable glutathione S-transferase GSTU6 [Brachypodium distachyon]
MAAAAAEEGRLKLLGFWSSPFVLRTRYALNLKGIPYTNVEEDLFGAKSELLLAANPAHGGKVPALLLPDGRSVSESLIIVEYLDEAFPGTPPRLLPSDPHRRATARFWAAHVDGALLPAWIPLYGGSTAEERVEAARRVVGVLETFEGVLRRGDCCSSGEEEEGGFGFFGGDSVGLVDVVLGGFIGWLRASEAMCGVKTIEDGSRTPLLAAWAERFAALEGVREILPEVGRLVEYNQMKRALRGLPFLPPHQQQ